MAALQFRSDYAHTDEGRKGLKALIGDIFAVDITPLDRLGHDPSVIAFGWWQGDRLVANVSLYARQLWLKGECVQAFGVQSVAVRPEWRGRGLFRSLMQHALAYADRHAELMILTTGTPDLYRPFGFHSLKEHRFHAKAAIPSRPPCNRQLSLADPADVTLVQSLFARRSPTSAIAAATDHPALFMLKAWLTPEIAVMHLPEHDAVVAVDGLDQDTLMLLDVVAAKIPTLDAIVAALGFARQSVDIRLTPDIICPSAKRGETVENGHMLRGLFPLQQDAIIFTQMHI
ncbi:GNAT family N-acetyltransferase [Martelella alba]|uniref:GNAT family N-acetyltransferase n=1 Tax=Martelella alba TaxID=2590451 RepID=A0A506U5X9_9HYPH|nr:GNAT family N-acetyltransferase [Martelella alba]TPW29763.1 GNAT family N-acetyltransferase [Martelella alba]